MERKRIGGAISPIDSGKIIEVKITARKKSVNMDETA
jgi:hypothetical protein